MKLVSNYREGLRWWSTRAFIALAALPTVWLAIPADLQAALPDWAKPLVLVLIALGGLAGRFVSQGGGDQP